MVPIYLLFVAMFTMITIIGSLFLLHLKDHEKESVDAEEFARTLLDRFDEIIEEKLNETDEES